MTFHYVGSDPTQRSGGTTHAIAAARRGELVAVNVDGAYAVITDAFSHRGIDRIVEWKQRPGMSVPVLIGRLDTVDGIAALRGDSASAARTLMRDCWPGPLTLLAPVQPTLPWTCTPNGVVAMRMPLHPWTLEVVRGIGPTACVPTHALGEAPHTSIDEVTEALAGIATLFLDGGPCLPDQTSTIVDVTGDEVMLVREGAFTRERLLTLGLPLL